MDTGIQLLQRITAASGVSLSGIISAGGVIGLVIALFIVLGLLIRNIRVVPQAHNFVVERLGTYKTTWDTGLHVKVPFVDRVAKVVSLKEKVFDFAPQAVITKDNVTMQIDTVLFYQITDPKLFVYGIERPAQAIENLTATTLRNIIGDLELDETLTSRDLINTKMREILDVATDPWGIRVNRVELKNILPPADIQAAMERQMKAEREKRENILRSEGKKEAAIRVAEGEKEAAILRADAKKETSIREAEGQAQAILTVQEATARGLQMIKEAGIDDKVISLESLRALEKVAQGQATKIIVPSELQNLATLGLVLKESTMTANAASPQPAAAPNPGVAPSRRTTPSHPVESMPQDNTASVSAPLTGTPNPLYRTPPQTPPQGSSQTPPQTGLFL
jgi:regulator of protease activity HflC (stomatin/prohibitin superfamily)